MYECLYCLYCIIQALRLWPLLLLGCFAGGRWCRRRQRSTDWSRSRTRAGLKDGARLYDQLIQSSSIVSGILSAFTVASIAIACYCFLPCGSRWKLARFQVDETEIANTNEAVMGLQERFHSWKLEGGSRFWDVLSKLIHCTLYTWFVGLQVHRVLRLMCFLDVCAFVLTFQSLLGALTRYCSGNHWCYDGHLSFQSQCGLPRFKTILYILYDKENTAEARNYWGKLRDVSSCQGLTINKVRVGLSAWNGSNYTLQIVTWLIILASYWWRLRQLWSLSHIQCLSTVQAQESLEPKPSVNGSVTLRVKFNKILILPYPAHGMFEYGRFGDTAKTFRDQALAPGSAFWELIRVNRCEQKQRHLGDIYPLVI